MSAEATNYVLHLRSCPDGAQLTTGHKCLLFCLADHHNRTTRDCTPGYALLAEESLCSLESAKRGIRYLEAHGVIERVHPPKQGSGQLTRLRFRALVESVYPHQNRGYTANKGVMDAPLLVDGRGSEGGQEAARRGSEGGQGEPRNKEESRNQRQSSNPRAVNLRGAGLVSVEEIDNSPEMQAFREKVFLEQKSRRVEPRKVPVWVES